ncbi:MAG: hypothetical protein ACYCWE_06670 [Eubacteriales bacterium]
MTINITDDKNCNWNEIKTEDDIKLFLKKYIYFHDSYIISMKYEPVTWCPIKPDGSNNYNLILTITFVVYSLVNPLDTVLVKKSIEVVFAKLKKLNFLPLDQNGLWDIYDVTMKIINDVIYWGITKGPLDEPNEYGFSDNRTWLKCEMVRWQEIDSIEVV